MAQGFEVGKNTELKENWCDGLPERGRNKGKRKSGGHSGCREQIGRERTDRKGAKMHSQRL